MCKKVKREESKPSRTISDRFGGRVGGGGSMYALHTTYLPTRRVMFLPPSLRLTFLIELPLATFVVTAALANTQVYLLVNSCSH